MMLTAERVRALLTYDPLLGTLTWRVKRSNAVPAGSVAGSIRSDGYRFVEVDGRAYPAHRLAWLHTYGEWPSLHVDHADGDKLNNRIANLREATRAQNLGNSRRSRANTSGFKSVHQRANGRWQARIPVDGKRVSLGHFDTKEEAHAAYAAAARDVYGEFARAG